MAISHDRLLSLLFFVYTRVLGVGCELYLHVKGTSVNLYSFCDGKGLSEVNGGSVYLGPVMPEDASIVASASWIQGGSWQALRCCER